MKLAVALWILPLAFAVDENAVLDKLASAAVQSAKSDLVEITVEPSRTQSILGTVSGVHARIRNISARPLRFFEHRSLFVAARETRSSDQGLTRGCATFITQGTVRTAQKQSGFDIVIQPGETYPAFWDFDTDGCSPGNQPVGRTYTGLFSAAGIKEAWQSLMFTPGNYKVFFVAQCEEVATDPASKAEPVTHTVMSSAPIAFTAAQDIILWGALLGGILAWFVKQYWSLDGGTKSKLIPVELAASGLFSVTMVILGSRLSDMFPIKVNANDFWGAITLGFIAQFLGVKLLAKLPGVTPAARPPARP
jgi:hypothetical protein